LKSEAEADDARFLIEQQAEPSKPQEVKLVEQEVGPIKVSKKGWTCYRQMNPKKHYVQPLEKQIPKPKAKTKKGGPSTLATDPVPHC
jgi:hypothetical protein